MAETSIEWTDATWNPVAGCTVLTAGCTNCYAMRMAARLDAMGMGKYRGLTRKSGKRAVWTGKIRLDEASLAIPKSWSKPRKVFVNSMSDLFHEEVPVEFIAKVWAVMKDTPRHTYQIRPNVRRAWPTF
jgi:protein gp37